MLPFINRSPNPADEFFADGLADELLSVLGKVPGLRVAARSSAFRFKGQATSADAAGRVLKVATVLEGSVRSSGDHVRVAVQLVNVEDGLHLWSETYDRTSNDVLAVQDEIAQAVVRELRGTLLGEESGSGAVRRAKEDVAAALRGRSRNPDAHRLYLRARQLLVRFNRENLDQAAELLRQAVALDPEYAVAWAELGGIYTRQASWGWTPRSDGYERALKAVERALSIEPQLAEAHSQLGVVRLNGFWDLRGAGESFQVALALDANNPRCIAAAGTLAACMGRVDEAIHHFRRIVELDPLSASSYNQLGYYLQSAGRLAESETTFRNALEIAPQLAGSRALLAYTLLGLGRGEEALAEVTREVDPPHHLWGLAIVHSALGHSTESDAALRELIQTTGDGNAYQIAEVYAARGEKDEAFAWLERMHEQRDPGAVDMAVSPLLRKLEDDPRWGQLCARMGIGTVETSGIGTEEPIDAAE